MSAIAAVFVVRNRPTGRAQPVYNISVDDSDGEGEYFANGILVHNCAASRYALMSYWKPAKAKKEWPTVSDDTGREVDYRKGKLVPHKHAADELEELAVASNTRVRRTHMPNPMRR